MCLLYFIVVALSLVLLFKFSVDRLLDFVLVEL